MNARYEIGQPDRSGITVLPDMERGRTMDACLTLLKRRQDSIKENKELGGLVKGMAHNGFITVEEKGAGINYTYASDGKYSRTESYTDKETGETEFLGRITAKDRYLTFQDTDSWQRIFTAIECEQPTIKRCLPGGADSLIDRKALAKLIYQLVDRNALMVMEKITCTVPMVIPGCGSLVDFKEKKYWNWVIDFDELLVRTVRCAGNSIPDRFMIQLVKALCLAARMTTYAFCVVPDYSNNGKPRFMPDNNPTHIFGDSGRYPAEASTPEFMEAHAEEEVKKAIKIPGMVKLMREAIKPDGVIAAVEAYKDVK